MTDLRSLDTQPEHDDPGSMQSIDRERSTDVDPGPSDDEIRRLRQENERLKKGLREIRQLLEPAVPSPDGPKTFPAIGLL